jgi:hypothetical protein
MVRDEVLGSDGTKHDVTRADTAHDFISFMTVVIITGRRVRGGIVGVEDPSPLIGQWTNGVGRYVIGGKGRDVIHESLRQENSRHHNRGYQVTFSSYQATLPNFL